MAGITGVLFTTVSQTLKGITHIAWCLDQFNQHTFPTSGERFVTFGMNETDVVSACPLADATGCETHTTGR
jgi:hypothetical protein